MRYFIAIDLPEDVSGYLATVQQDIGQKYAGVKYVERENLHITFKFLGEIDHAAEVKKKLESTAFEPFSVKLDKIGAFPNLNNPRVIWVSVRPTDKILDIYNRVDKLITGGDDRFNPHITIGRLKFIKDKPLLKDLLSGIKIEPMDFVIDSIRLKNSILTPRGPIYENV
jgi:2'-5' RNA ligase